MNAPVAITGLGVICGAGRTPAAIMAGLCAGRVAMAPVRQWDSSAWPVPLGSEVAEAEPAKLFSDRKLLKSLQRLRRTDLLGLYAASKAVESSGLPAWRQILDSDALIRFNDRTGVYVGAGGIAYQNQYDFLPALAAGGNLPEFARSALATVNPTWLLQVLPNNVLCYLGIRYGFKGVNGCVTTHSVSGLLAVIEGLEAIRADLAERVVTVGHDAPIEPQLVINLAKLGLLSADAVRPFDAARSGCLLGEGAGALVLESIASARARDAAVLAEVLGAGVSCEGAGILDLRPDGQGLVRAIEAALADAAIAPAEVGLIIAHGNGGLGSDRSEARAIEHVFGADCPPLTAFKWCYGHSMAAAAVIDAVMAIQCLREGVVPAIATLRTPDSGLGLNLATGPRRPRGPVALILSRGFSAMNVALILRGANA